MTEKTKQTPSLEQQNTTHSDCKSGWTDNEKKALAVVAFPYLEALTQYQKRDPKLVMQVWERKFSGVYSIEQLIYAIDFHTDTHETFPAPSHVNEILNPAPPTVSKSDYIAALEWQKRNNRFDKFTDQHDTIKAFENQGREEKEQFKIHSEQLAKLAGNSLKRIEK